MNGDPLTGAEKELQEHRGLSGHAIPWDLIGPRTAPRTEDRADAVSPAARRFALAATSDSGPRFRPVRDDDVGRGNAACGRRRTEFSRRNHDR